MPTSQFTIYTSSDPFGPGPLTGTTGSLVSVLDACLVNGYTNRPAAGWTKPFANSASVYACYKQASGSQFTFFINDNAPNTAKEAGFTGWISMSALIPSGSAANFVGAGLGQFPLPAQVNTFGRLAIRKSSTADTTARVWVVAADAYTFYIWIQDGTTATTYTMSAFGEFYSLYGSGIDSGSVVIISKSGENTVQFAGFDQGDSMIVGPWPAAATNELFQAQLGHFIARNPKGTGQSLPFVKKGDYGLGKTVINANNGSGFYSPMSGVLQGPSPIDGTWALSKLWIIDSSTASIRGIMRGFWHICHDPANFTDGQIISGGGNLSGKTFLIIKPGYNGGMWAMETSATIDTN